MSLRNLSKPQWDAALEAARVLTTCSPDREEDRARYRDAKAKLTALLPEDADARSIIEQAIHWDMVNAIAEACASAGLTLGAHGVNAI